MSRITPTDDATQLVDNVIDFAEPMAARAQWLTSHSKVPHSPRTGLAVGANNRGEWATLAAACEAIAHPKGRTSGHVLSFAVGDGLCGADLDHCRNPVTGAVEPWALEFVATADTYTESSPSGTGLRLFWLGDGLPDHYANKRRGRELYTQDRHLTVTGAHLYGSLQRGDTLALHAALFGPTEATPQATTPPEGPESDADVSWHGIEDGRLLGLAGGFANGEAFAALMRGDTSGYGGDDSVADLALCNALAFACGPSAEGREQADRLFRRSGLLRDKWDERRGGSTYGADTLARAYRTRADGSPRTVEDYYGGPGGLGERPTLSDDSHPRAATDVPRKALTRRRFEGEPERVRWLWDGWLPFGKLCVQDGDPDKGKSTILLDLAARVTTGAAMPDGSPGLPGGGFVFVLMGEDGHSDTVHPRLIAAGANLSRIEALAPSEVLIPRDVPLLEDAIRDTGAVLLVFDPLNFYLGDERVNTNSDKQVRVALNPLIEMAERTGCIIIGNRHLNKGGTGPAIYRGMGSIGIGGLARSVWCVADEPGDGDGYIMASVKHNLTKRPDSLRYSIEGVTLPTGSVSRIAWGDTSGLTADDILGEDKAEATALVVAIRELEALLSPLGAEGMAVDDVKGWAKADGHTWRTLERAKVKLGVLSVKQGFTCWTWVLPPPGARVSG
jgi:hypothetical protein